MTTMRLRRSVLDMPGSNRRALEKARGQVCRAVAGRDDGDRERVIRVDAPQTPWGDADLRAAIETCDAASGETRVGP